MSSRTSAVKGLAAAFLISLSSAPLKADVIELALLMDGSNSIASSDFLLQKTAYANIFMSGSFYDDYVVGNDDLYVSTWQFSTGVSHEQDWMLINDNASAIAFGQTFLGIQQHAPGWTNTATATTMAVDSILNNGIDSDRAVIDVSTDGLPTRCYPECYGYNNDYYGARDAAMASAVYADSNGVTINAIGVGSALNVNNGLNFLDTYTSTAGGFYTLATDFGAFQEALELKLFREINVQPVPEPAALVLLSLGLVSLCITRQRRKSL